MFFKNDNKGQYDNNLSKVAALLIHAAKIDQNYSDQEENIIKKTMFEIGANKENIQKIMDYI